MKKGSINKNINRVGEKYITNEGYEITIINHYGCKNYTIQFQDGAIIEGVDYRRIKNGAIRNRNKISVYGAGYHGYGIYSGVDSNNKETKTYGTWRGMLRRCYYEPHIKQQETYRGCSVTKEWLNFQNFAEWFEGNWKPWMDENWQLDKDILIKGNKIYSSETCVFVPNEINSIFINNYITVKPKSIKKVGTKYQSTVYLKGESVYLGTFNTEEEAFQAYKTAKESYIKEVADKWKDKIDPRVYEAMYKYQVEIKV